MRFALITGGTSGIGLSFARALARDGASLVLVARDRARLDAVADELRGAHGVPVETLVADLAERDDQARVAKRLGAGDIDTLVNNAGFSLKTPLVGGDDALADAAYEVMGRAPRVLASAVAPAMRERGEGWIINVVSVSALTRQDSYSALKAYALALTEVLALELTGTGVNVTAVLPGWTRTEFHSRGGSGRKGVPGFLWLDADRVTEVALADARAGHVISIPSKRYKVAAAVLQLLPNAAVREVSRRIKGKTKTPSEGAVS
ncbi:SDR family NAD(P)-dependent oxidoreductase [Propioniciclava sinopodophylli]|uniref:SDR family NAD(P)-dependent oxidoreductase n=1 Tax=Propioniciclava sinopodophylli TaxID=1837344 RepID=A0A4Q9KEU2_9ACTN|nr:SDR family NAD(P)-dependent oxidoreductase [Propioniciclava sinopodophylli]TBT85069.1 SDR family NAD(P)-dependent oxidoreductase [Propioniciclava sinopodophylli]